VHIKSNYQFQIAPNCTKKFYQNEFIVVCYYKRFKEVESKCSEEYGHQGVF